MLYILQVLIKRIFERSCGMKKTILILTNKAGASVKLVIKHLKNMSENFFVFDTSTFLENKSITLSLNSGRMTGHIKDYSTNFIENTKLVDWENVKSVWHRKPALPRAPNNLKGGYGKFIENESRATLWTLYNTLDARWVNSPIFSSKLIEDNKLFQLKKARFVGLTTPDTIISNNQDDIVSFASKYNYVAIKLIYASVFRKNNGELMFVYTNKINVKDILFRRKDIKLCPIMLQEYVHKKIELRITIIGKKIYTCAIHSQDNKLTMCDWRRYDFANVKHEICKLPEDIELKLLKLMEVLNIYYGAIDMIVTPNDEYVFLEVNPNGEWVWIEELTNMPISESIAEFLRVK